MENVKKLLAQIKISRKNINDINHKLQGKYAPDFRLYNFIQNNENGLSNCIASLLQPNGNHGQGSLYLRLFLEHLSIPNFQSSEKNLNNTKVLLEQSTDKNRRIDIFIDIPNVGIIGIENKPWAVEQDNQLHDYADYLSKHYGIDGNWLLLYLSNREPSSIAEERRTKLEKEDKFKAIDFNFINSWLDDCLEKTRPNNVRFFIEELIVWIDEKVNGKIDMSEHQEIVNVVSNKENIAAAMAVFRSIPDVKEKLMKKLLSDLTDKCSMNDSLSLKILSDKNFSESGFAFCLDFYKEKNQDISFTFEFSRSEFNGFCWGMRRKSSDYYDKHRWEHINEIISGDYGYKKTYEWWPWSTYADYGMKEDYCNWQNNSQAWENIANGKLSEEIFNMALKIRTLFKDKEYLLFK